MARAIKDSSSIFLVPNAVFFLHTIRITKYLLTEQININEYIVDLREHIIFSKNSKKISFHLNAW